jgi:hypothetical protein
MRTMEKTKAKVITDVSFRFIHRSEFSLTVDQHRKSVPKFTALQDKMFCVSTLNK